MLFGLFVDKPQVKYKILRIRIGLEITSQSLLATPKRHYATVVFECIPALAFLSARFRGQLMGNAFMRDSKWSLDSFSEHLRESIATANLVR